MVATRNERAQIYVDKRANEMNVQHIFARIEPHENIDAAELDKRVKTYVAALPMTIEEQNHLLKALAFCQRLMLEMKHTTPVGLFGVLKVDYSAAHMRPVPVICYSKTARRDMVPVCVADIDEWSRATAYPLWSNIQHNLSAHLSPPLLQERPVHIWAETTVTLCGYDTFFIQAIYIQPVYTSSWLYTLRVGTESKRYAAPKNGKLILSADPHYFNIFPMGDHVKIFYDKLMWTVVEKSCMCRQGLRLLTDIQDGQLFDIMDLNGRKLYF